MSSYNCRALYEHPRSARTRFPQVSEVSRAFLFRSRENGAFGALVVWST